MIRKRILVRGEVQGVGFRYHSRGQALRLGLVGYVRNRPDGSVELEIEGSEESVSRMLRWLHTGPRYAVVTALEVSDVTPTGEAEFLITR